MTYPLADNREILKYKINFRVSISRSELDQSSNQSDGLTTRARLVMAKLLRNNYVHRRSPIHKNPWQSITPRNPGSRATTVRMSVRAQTILRLIGMNRRKNLFTRDAF